MASCQALHTGLLLLAGTGAAVLAAGTVELPGKVKEERAAGGVAGIQLARSEDGSPSLAGVEQVHAARVNSQ